MGVVYSRNNTLKKDEVAWRWEYEPNNFQPYSAEISALIEKHYLSGSNFLIQISPNDVSTYHIDLKELVQINTFTKKKRKILRDIQQDTSSTTRWTWETESHEMQLYSAEISEKIEAHYQKKGLSPLKLNLYGRHYLVDPSKKFQMNISSKKKRKIERNTIPDHKYIWQWQHDDGTFISYPETESYKIEIQYVSKRGDVYNMTVNGVIYLINTERMTQVNSQTNKVSQIRRVDKNYVKYGWFWRDRDGKWNPFSLYFAEKLEGNYLSLNQSHMLIYIDGHQFDVDTKEMTERSIKSGNHYKIKREALSNDRAVWLWKSQKGSLRPFPAYFSHSIETQYMLNDSTSLPFKFRDKTYQLSAETMRKLNVENNTYRQLERRIVSNNYPSELELLSTAQCKNVFRYLSTSGYIPPDWEWNQEEKVSILPVSDIERTILTSQFCPGKYGFLEIVRVQNQHLMNYFLLERMNIQHFLHGADEPTLLFYLSDKQEKPEEIYEALECGLANRSSQTNNYGEGLYFTKNSKVAAQHAFAEEGKDYKVVLCFWVLLGRIASIDDEDDQKAFYSNKYDKLSDIKKAPSECDSVSGLIDGEEVFVLYKPERCYPLYSIKYRDINSG